MKQIAAILFVVFSLVMCNQSGGDERAVFVKICRQCADTTECNTYFFKRVLEGENPNIDTAKYCNLKTFSPADVPDGIQTMRKDTVRLMIDCK
jgi:hypothetical protein